MKDKFFTKEEIKVLKKLDTPVKIQEFIDSLSYNNGRRVSVIDVFREKVADCLEAACFASYIFSLNNIKDNFIMDLSSFCDDDHVICVFKINGLYGAVAQSKYLGLKYKSPAYKNLRELSMSYFEHYFNYKGVLDLREYSIPVKLNSVDTKWISSKRFMYKIEDKLRKVKHFTLLKKNIKVPKVSRAVFERETLIIPKGAKVGKEYKSAYKKIKKI